MIKANNKRSSEKALLISLAGKGNGNIMKKKTSNQIVEELKSKGIHAEVCIRHRG